MNEPTINVNECAANFIKGEKIASVTAAAGTKWNNRLRKWAEEFPEAVQILAINEDGSVFAHFPSKFVKLERPVERKGREMTDEQKAAAAERLRAVREKQKAEREAEREAADEAYRDYIECMNAPE